MPGLGSVPVLGALFRSTNFNKDETELLIVVTPHLVAPIRADQVLLPTESVLDPRESDAFILGQPYSARKTEKPTQNPEISRDVTDVKEGANVH